MTSRSNSIWCYPMAASKLSAAFVISQLGRFPEVGEKVAFEPFLFEVLARGRSPARSDRRQPAGDDAMNLGALVVDGRPLARQRVLCRRRVRLHRGPPAGHRRSCRAGGPSGGDDYAQLAGCTGRSAGGHHPRHTATWFRRRTGSRRDHREHHSAGCRSPPVSLHTISLVVALLIVVFLHMVIGEMAPKNVAIATPERLAVWLGGSLSMVYDRFRPLVAISSTGSANSFLRIFGVRTRDELETAHTAEDLASVIAAGRQEGVIEEFASKLLSGAIRFSETRRLRGDGSPARHNRPSFRVDPGRVGAGRSTKKASPGSRSTARTSTTSPASSTPRICSASLTRTTIGRLIPH